MFYIFQKKKGREFMNKKSCLSAARTSCNNYVLGILVFFSISPLKYLAMNFL